MPQLPHSIELHDSRLSGIERDGKSIYIYFIPAYIHREGKGWTQDVKIIINEEIVEGNKVDLPATLVDGWMHTQLGPYHNLLNIPFVVGCPVTLGLELMSGEVIKIKGNGISHDFKKNRWLLKNFQAPDTALKMDANSVALHLRHLAWRYVI
jgi:hypothetical protein